MRLAMVVKALLVGGGNAFQALDRAAGVAEYGGDGGEAIGRGFFQVRVYRDEQPGRLGEGLNAFIGSWFAGFAHSGT
jgi:hypothetical protein